MPASSRTSVVNTAPRHNQHVAIFADKKVVVHEVSDSRVGNDYGDVHALATRVGCNADVDTWVVSLTLNYDVCTAISA